MACHAVSGSSRIILRLPGSAMQPKLRVLSIGLDDTLLVDEAVARGDAAARQRRYAERANWRATWPCTRLTPGTSCCTCRTH